jgi:hypothetical protein
VTTAYEARLATRYETLDRSPVNPLHTAAVLLTDDPDSPESAQVIDLAETGDLPLRVVELDHHGPDALAAIIPGAAVLILTVPAAEQVHYLLSSGFIRRMPERTYLLGSEFDNEDALLRLAMMIRAGGFGPADRAVEIIGDPTLAPTWAEAKTAYAALQAENRQAAAEAAEAHIGHTWTQDREVKTKAAELVTR